MGACTGLFWVNGFDQVQKRQGVRGIFLDFLKRQGLWTPGNYYCAKNSTTPSTAISKEQFAKLAENNQAEIWLGVLDGGRWRIYRLDKCRIRNGFADKKKKNLDDSRLNVDENLGEEVHYEL